MKTTKSLRWRIVVWHGLLLIVVIALSGIAAYRHQSTSALRRVDNELRERLAVIQESMPLINASVRRDRQGTDPSRPFLVLPPERAALFDAGHTPMFYFAIWRRDGMQLALSDGAPADIPRPFRAEPGTLREVMRSRGVLRETFSFTPFGECQLIGRSTAPELKSLRDYRTGIIAVGLALFALGSGGSWWLISRALRPLSAITHTARAIAGGRLDARIPAADTESELGELATTLNATFAELEAAFARQSRFTADAAHELCTPISIIVSHAQRGLRSERSAEENRELFDACLRAARRMERLTKSLLTLAQQDSANAASGPHALERQPCDLAILTRDAAALLQPAAEAKGLILSLNLAPASCNADSDGITQIILNLLTNAIEHTVAGGITLHTRESSGHAVLSVADTGPGIAPQHLPHLFDRFYRAEASRSRKAGGAGLGLAISEAIAKAHGGEIEVDSTIGRGSTFTLRIPLA